MDVSASAWIAQPTPEQHATTLIVADEEDEHCELVEVCPIRIPVRKLHEKLREFLDNVTIAELASAGHYVDLQLSGRELRATAP